ncbi:MAG: amidohydrolase family protein [Deltaproteobacteria bacterium]|nr:amidohydrolase family protein [Deltaproteobacteria bacterium]
MIARAPLALLLAALALAAGACRSGRPGRVPGAPEPQRLAIRGNVIQPDGTVLPDALVLVDGNRIAAVGPARGVAVPPGTPVLGDAAKWILPGLVDAHVHLFQSGGLYARPDLVDLTARVPYPRERAAVRAGIEDTLRRTLRSGITSVLDAGGPMWNFEVRALAARTPLAPRVAVAGPLLSPVARPQLDAGDPPVLRVTDPGVARALVRTQASLRPDLVKLLWLVPPGSTVESWRPVARAAIQEAHRLGLRVGVHAAELATARAAVAEGADLLCHDVDDAEVDGAFIEALRARGTVYVSTLVAQEATAQVFRRQLRFSALALEVADPAAVASVSDPFPLPEPFRAEAPTGVRPAAARNVVRLARAGIPVAAGSEAGDIGVFHGTALHRQLQLLVEAGLSRGEALAAATAGAARALGRADELGAVQVGKLADLLVLEASPLEALRNTTRIHAVVKDGTWRRPAEILPRTAADVVQAQHSAWNAGDLDGLLSTFADDAQVRSVSGGLLATGKEAIGERFARVLADRPRGRVRVLERRGEGPGVVLDHEEMSGWGPEPLDLGWVRYEVEEGRIRRLLLP